MSAFETNADSCADWDPEDIEVADRGEVRDLGAEFELLYREHYAFVWRNARRMLPGRSEAEVEDLIQDTFTSAYRRFESYDGRASQSTWLFGILRNVARNHARGERRRIRRRAALAQQQELGRCGRDEQDRVLAKRMLEGFLAQLDADKRAVFVLAELEGLTGREIAAALDVNANTVNTRLRAARERFCVYFELPRSRDAIRRRTRPLRKAPDQPPPEARARSRALLLVGLGKLGGGSAALGGATLLGLGKAGLLQLGLGLAMVLGVGAAVAVSVGSTELPGARAAGEGATAVARGADEDPGKKPGVLAAGDVDEGDVDEGDVRADEGPREDPQAVPTSDERRPEQPAPRSASTVRVETSDAAPELLRQARATLVEGDAPAALRLLDRVDVEAGGLRAQRDATRIAALCELGRGAEAEAVAAALARDEPESAMIPRLAHACW